MPDILIRGLDEETLQRLKDRAKRNGRSLQGEARLVLEHAAGVRSDEVRNLLAKWSERFSGRDFSSSVDLLREDRDR